MPVAGEQPPFDGALVEGETHVGAAILQGPGTTVVPEDDHGTRPDLRQEAPLAFEVAGRSGEDPIGRQRRLCCHDSHDGPRPPITSSAFFAKSSRVARWRNS